MIGLFFEDINFAADGGLYAELLENRSFEAIKSKGSPRNYVLKEDNLYAWHSINQKEEKLEISSNQPVSEKNPHYLRFTADNAAEGFYNKAYDGISLKKGMKYNVSFYAREVDYLKGDLLIRVTKNEKTYAESTVKFIIAQRINSVQDSDKILVLEEGKIHGFGTHEELLENNHIYKDVFESQTKGDE